MVDFMLDPRNVARAGWCLAFVPPVAAVTALVLHEPWRRRLLHSAVFWTAVGAGPLIVALWFVFNAVEDFFGLDSVLALTLNLVLFCLVGLGVSWLLRSRAARRSADASEEEGDR